MFRSQANAVTTMQAATISPMAAISHMVLRLTAETRLIIRNLLRRHLRLIRAVQTLIFRICRWTMIYHFNFNLI